MTALTFHPRGTNERPGPLSALLLVFATLGMGGCSAFELVITLLTTRVTSSETYERSAVRRIRAGSASRRGPVALGASLLSLVIVSCVAAAGSTLRENAPAYSSRSQRRPRGSAYIAWALFHPAAVCLLCAALRGVIAIFIILRWSENPDTFPESLPRAPPTCRALVSSRWRSSSAMS